MRCFDSPRFLEWLIIWDGGSTVDVTRDSHSAWTSFHTNICCMNITVRASSGLHAEERLLRTCDPARTDLPPHTWIELQKSLFSRNFLICSIMIGAFWIINLLHWFGEVARFRNIIMHYCINNSTFSSIVSFTFCTKFSALLHPFRSISIILSCQQ